MREVTPAKPGVLLIESQGVLGRLASKAGLETWTFTRADRLASVDRLLQTGNFQALVLELRLPDAEGLDAYRRARALAPGLPIVAVAESRDAALAEAVVAEGAQACLPRESLIGPGAPAALDWSLRQAILRSGAEARRYRALFDSAPIGILLAAGRRIAMANPAALEALGYTEAELARVSVVDLFPEEKRARVERALDAAGAVGEVPDTRFEAALRRSDGTAAPCRVFLEGALLNDAPAVSMYLAFTGEAAPRPDGDSRAEVMAALGRMAGGLAHDLNNLLTAVNGHAEHLAAIVGGDGPVARGAASIRKAGDAAAALARGLGEFGRAFIDHPASHTLSDARVDAAVDRAAPALSALAGRCELRVRPGAGFAAVRLEPGALEGILRALVSRARDTMPEGGIVTLATRISEVTERRALTHLAAGAGPHVVIEVGDSDRAADPRALERLFEPFALRGRGGMEMASVYAVVKAAGGGIAATAEPGRGSRIAVYLPARTLAPEGETPNAEAARLVAEAAHLLDDISRDRNAKVTPSASPAAAPKSGAAGTVLLVEDESSMREMMALVLQRFGYAVLETVSEAEAMKAAAAHPETDLVITDITLRGSYGHEMMERLRVLRPGLPALFVSGHPLEYLSDQGIRIPAEAFMEKPFTPAQLALKVRETLKARQIPS